MRKQRSRNPILLLILALVAQLVVAPTAAPAQQQGADSLVDEADMDAAVARHLESEEAARQDLRDLLQRPLIREIAERWGLDLRRAADAVDTLEDDELAEASARADAIEDALAGGDSVITIGLVPLLLIIIIIILLA